MFQLTISAIIRWSYKNKKKGKTDKTKEMASLFTMLFKPELIIVTSRNNKILNCHSVSVGKNCK